MDLALDDKVALVTASSKGIGWACARALLEAGATVATNGRDQQRLEAGMAGLTGLAGTATAHPADLTDPDATEGLLDAVLDRHGRLDVLVVNTGGPKIAPVLDLALDDWSDAFHLLLRPALQLSRRAAEVMVAQGSGSIVFITSTWVRQPKAGGALSAVMRSGVSALAKQLSLELAPDGVRVNQVMPGVTATDRMQDIVAATTRHNRTTAAEEEAKILAEVPVGRWGRAEEIADAVVFLSSPRAEFITGVALAVDGGSIRSTT